MLVRLFELRSTWVCLFWFVIYWDHYLNFFVVLMFAWFYVVFFILWRISRMCYAKDHPYSWNCLTPWPHHRMMFKLQCWYDLLNNCLPDFVGFSLSSARFTTWIELWFWWLSVLCIPFNVHGTGLHLAPYCLMMWATIYRTVLNRSPASYDANHRLLLSNPFIGHTF